MVWGVERRREARQDRTGQARGGGTVIGVDQDKVMALVQEALTPCKAPHYNTDPDVVIVVVVVDGDQHGFLELRVVERGGARRDGCVDAAGDDVLLLK